MPRGGGRGRGRGRGGGGRGRGRGRGGGGGGGGGGRQFQDNRQSFEEVNKRNDKLERYYNTLNIVPEGEEREKFWTALRRELPNSFRFTGSKGHALSVRNNLVERFFPIISQIKHEGKPVDLPQSMKWYPEGLAYSMTTPKNVVRKYEPFKEFQRFLVSETGVGNISRQEHVSMIPPLVMDIRPEHTVLDLCAAPGSKSAQLIEAIHAGEEERVAGALKQVGSGGQSSVEDGGRATGLLVANDVNYQRAQMLVHQVKRLNSPNLIVMNHDATMFPSIELPSYTPPGQPKRGKYLKFDRILADVPCSGDGTCRKNPSIWKEWSPQNGLGLYITQVRILTRAMQMLKVGGRVVYSTCSMNPVEDEAVVASAIERCGGVAKVKLLDTAEMLPGLERAKGLKDWSIMNRTGRMYESWAEAEGSEGEGSKMAPGMFAPESEEKIPLEHCMRVYPHQQDTGAFFIAVLEKLSEIRAKPENESKCMNKQWAFTAPVEAADPTKNTAFGELLADVENEQPDAHGHLRKHGAEGIHGNGDLSAAERQNEIEDNGLKRKAEELGEDPSLEPKKPKFGDEPADLVSTTNTTRREHYPLPPSVAMAVEADGGVPGSEVIDSGDVKMENDADMKDAAETAPFDASTADEIKAQLPRPNARGDRQANVEAFKYLSSSHPELESIYKFYELHSSFPRDRFLVRNPAGDPVKGIYYSSQLVKDILTVNSEGKGMKFVHAGVKMFMKQDAQGQDICRWRIQLEGLPVIEGWVGEGRVIHLTKRSTLRKLLIEMFPRVGKAKGEEKEGWELLGEIGEQVRDMGMGCCVLRVEPSENAEGFTEPLTLPLWRSMHSLNLMLPKEDRKAMLLRIYNEDVELINHSDPTWKRDNHVKQKTGADDAVVVKNEPVSSDDKKETDPDIMRNGHLAEKTKEEDTLADTAQATAGAGSIPAEDDAKRLEDLTARTTNQPGITKTDPIDPEALGSKQTESIKEEQLGFAAQALEEDAVVKRDRMEGGFMEVEESEDAKVAENLPERAGEGDEANRTV
ncbi:tRNA (cytosine-5-)-methyltransferase ncl1 [Recurvomyces mirabilis]|nr:tRNA (cytosine-5-)-methyltransferase ncl1 [Recurvomyces mirabilis]